MTRTTCKLTSKNRDQLWNPILGNRLCATFLIIIIIIAMTIFVVLSSWQKWLREFTQFIWWMQTERRVAANHQSKPIELGCWSAENWLLPSTSTIAIVIITHPITWYSFCHQLRVKGWVVLGTAVKVRSPCPRLYIAAAITIPQHNLLQRDLNLGPLTPLSDALTTRLPRPAVYMFYFCSYLIYCIKLFLTIWFQLSQNLLDQSLLNFQGC